MSRHSLSLRRLSRAVANDLRLQYRHKFYHVYLIVTLLYVVVLRMLPAGVKQVALPFLIFTDPAMLGFYFVAALVLFEKEARSLEGLSVSPLRPLEYVLSKAISLSFLSMLASIALAVGSGAGRINYPLMLLTVFLTGMAYVLLGFIVAVRHTVLSSFLLESFVLATLLNIPILGFLGVFDTLLFYLWPAKPALQALGVAFRLWDFGAGTLLSIALLIGWNILLARIATRYYSRYVRGD